MSNAILPNSNGNGKRSPRGGPSQLGSDRTTDAVAPRTPAEEVVASVMASFLGVEGLGVHDSFFELGGNSLTAHQVVQELRSVFRIDLPLLSLFERPTVDAVVSAMAHMWGGREIVEEIAWTFAEVQQLTDFDAMKMLAELSVESVALDS